MPCFIKLKKKEWEKAVEQNTVESYSRYIENYPEGSNIIPAKEQLMQLKTPEGMVYVKGGTFQMGCISEQGCDCQDDNKPVHSVTISSYYIGAIEYCKWRGVRLPTEAEREYAARGGQNGKSTYYAGSNNIDEVAWYNGNSSVANSTVPGGNGTRGMMPVKQKIGLII